MGIETDTSHYLGEFRPLLLDMHMYMLQMRTLAETLPESETAQGIYDIGRHGLRMLDSALYALDVQNLELPLTTVSATAVLYDVCQELRALAQTYGADVSLEVTGRPAAVYSNAEAIRGAVHGLAANMITAMTTETADRRIVLNVQQTRKGGQRIGVFAPALSLPNASVRASTALRSCGRSVLPDVFSHSGTGLVVSQQLTRAIGTHVQAFRHRGIQGAGFYVSVSPQLSLLG